ncbi:APA family basic amino acid/polyamine antiporter [Runella defluvii]|uniref:APA family basic amino acid/polyamine antiporter n=1 Tax=Runella defluvii TaxID=370973 RepID=A0A7W5ZJI8_9BACT|nr:APC family permease [Runella defluvii]MBB3837057.1 APA family basic amino acid/polyamine antiporter [Runella defluvii]
MQSTDTQSKDNQLLKILGVGFGIAVTIGGTIGTGILRKPGPIAQALGDPWLIMGVWILVSVYALLGVLCTIELGVTFPKAGAWYVYARRAFGGYAGFVVGFNSWLGTSAATAFGAFTMSEYIALLLPSTAGYESYMATAILIGLGLLHWVGLRTASRAQEIMSVAKAVGLFGFVVICFVYGNDVSTDQVVETTTNAVAKGSMIGSLIFALQAIFYTFDGWHTAAYFAEEDADPARNLPKSMIGGLLLIVVIYLLVNAAILYILPMPALQQSKLAAADAITLIFGEQSGKIVTFFLMISILGIVNAQVMFNPRVLYSMSRDGLFIRQGTRVNAGGTPSIAMPLSVAMAIVFILSGKEASGKLSDIATFFFVIGYTSGFASLLYLRKSEPNVPRPWKVPGFPVVPWIVLVASVAFLVGAGFQDPGSSVYAVVFLVLSYPLYLGVRRLNEK